MSNLFSSGATGPNPAGASARPNGRRMFLKLSGGLFAAAVVSGCDVFSGSSDDDDAVDLGAGDIGVLNYAYALEQLEAAFYTQAVASFYGGATEAERQVLTSLRDHEIVHRDFLKAALGNRAIPALEVDFSTVDFTSRASVLGTARVLEDTGVAAYNGAGKLLTSPDFLLLAGKIVSVEARHAAAVRDLLQPNTAAFAGNDVVAPSTGLDMAKNPAEVLTAAGPFIVTEISASNLPRS